MKELYLSRHGQTLFNTMHLFQGWIDSPLTEEGIKQAKKSGKYLKDNNITFDYFACSTLERTEQTLENIIYEDLKHDRYKDLKEVFFGDLEGQTFEVEELKKSINSEEAEAYFISHHVETQSDATKRIDDVLESIRKNDGERALVVSHGLIISYYVSFKTAMNSNEIRMNNCDIAVFKNDGNTWVFDHMIRNDEI